jgi:phospholipid/cholesterol/gamma-HCH transport system substrate-binding protein
VGFSKRKIAVVVGVALVAVFIFLLFHAKDLAPGYVTLRTYLDDAAGLMDGTQVRLNGIPVGYLDAQKLTNSRNPSRKVEFDLKVKERYLREIPVDSTVGLASDNLLGDQYIGIRRGLSAEHVQPGAELATTQTQDITRMMAQMSKQLDRLEDVFTRASKLMSNVDTGKGALGKIVQNPQNAAGVSGELNQLVADIQHGHGTITKLFFEDPLDKQLQGPLKQLNAVTASANGTSARLKEFKDDLDVTASEFQVLQNELKAGNGSIAKLSQLQARFDELSGKIDGIMDKIHAGQGTIGQLMVNPQLTEALDGTTRELQELMKGLRTNPRKFVRIKVF